MWVARQRHTQVELRPLPECLGDYRVVDGATSMRQRKLQLRQQ